MPVSLFSRFQGCLLLTLLAGQEEGTGQDTTIPPRLESWSTIFHSCPYPGSLPAMVWQGEDLQWQSIVDFSHWLVVLALWHHENPSGFSTDLGRSAIKFTHQFPDYALSSLDQAWLQIWQRLLTLILSERFTLTQLPDLWRSPYLLDSLGLTDPIAQSCQRDLTAIATALENYQASPFPSAAPNQFALAHTIPQAIYHWAITPTQPRLSLLRAQTLPNSPWGLPFTAALSGAYNGKTIVKQALQTPQFSQTPLMSLIRRFAHHHYRHWLSGLSAPSNVLALAGAAPLVMQRRSGLKLVSQQDYDQFS
ncbi:MAG: hypothetical protein VKL20_01655 [Synechocystis sp.]|nr:hypothetical protein [Synechocystis sp.]